MWQFSNDGKWIQNNYVGFFKSPCCRSMNSLTNFKDDGTIVLTCGGIKFDIPCQRKYQATYNIENKNWTLEEIKKEN